MSKRISAVRERLIQEDIDAILITNPYNLRYVAHFTGTAGVAVITHDEAWFITDSRYTEQATHQAKEFEVITHQAGWIHELAPRLLKAGVRDLAFESEHVTYGMFDQLNEILSVSLVSTTNWIADIRQVKEPEELAIIQKACSIADEAFSFILDYIKPGQTEIEVANALDFKMRELGATEVSFDTIVASGVRGAMPHGVASDKVIEAGDMVTIDFGCYYKGYVSDMTRTFSIGTANEDLQKVHAAVLEAAQAGREAVKPGMTGIEVDRVVRDYLNEKGYGEYFTHSTGHGIGLEIHEGPAISSRSTVRLEPGHVITIEPGVYIPGLGGVRIEDDLLVTEDGAKVLTHSDRHLIEVTPR
ncbi:M24 family metallopeptidase [Atopobacter phocae]|uniref:M24 family metallopeptidase n=1 Tax=Atopobacter phocae TaxID=136492 RepID=UPI000471DD59|nr:aminopeptidase P family protein [Atopobacter phocae]